MIVRITKFKMLEGSREEADELVNTLKKRIMSLRGMKQFICAMNDDGSGYVVVVNESADDVAANENDAQELWSNFGKFLEAPPDSEDFEVVVDWSV